MKRRILSLLLCLTLCTALLPAPVRAAQDTSTPPAIPSTGDVWDGSISQPTNLIQKDGVYYYEITKCSQLAFLARTEDTEWLKYNYILGNDLILNDVVLTWDEEGNCTNTEELLEWTPIERLNGRFKGNGHTISGLYINDTEQDYMGLFAHLYGVADSLNITNSYVSARDSVGILAGRINNDEGEQTDCIVSGLVKGRKGVGGMIGDVWSPGLNGMTNYADVYGEENVAGIAGDYGGRSMKNCTNYGNIHAAGDYVGGIANASEHYFISASGNYGDVTGHDYVGGIIGDMKRTEVDCCFNAGRVTGNQYVGGISGNTSFVSANYWNSCIVRSYNLGSVTGASLVGGLTGALVYSEIEHSYNAGPVSFAEKGGAIVGDTDHIWGNSTITGCYYLKDSGHNSNARAFGNVSGDTAGVAQAASHSQMQQQATFKDWEFDRYEGWRIQPGKNGGYPYLSWQNPDQIPVTGVSLSPDALTMAVGDQTYLTAAVAPATAADQSCTWSSSNAAVAQVNDSGKVTAVAPGTAVITVTTKDGGHKATCSVTVTGRAAEEYRIDSITLRTSAGAALTSIPQGTSLATVSITNLTSQGDALVVLAAYTAQGQYQGLMWVRVKNLNVGGTLELTLPVDNSSGKIADLKAFAVSSFADMTPLGDAVSFLPK